MNNSGTIKLIRNNEVMAEQIFVNSHPKNNKEAVRQKWKHKYGKKFYECEVIIEHSPQKERIFIKAERPHQTRKRNKIPTYFIKNLANFYTEELLALKELVKSELNNRHKKAS